MKNTKTLLMAAAVSGALASYSMPAMAKANDSSNKPAAEKSGCSGKDGCGGKAEQKKEMACSGKDGCGSKDGKKKTDDKEKSACAGKDGCGGKDGKS